MLHDLISITIAFFGGFLPSIVWLVFWNEEKRKHEPKNMLALAFIGGMAAVFLSLLFEKIAFTADPNVFFPGNFLQSILGWFKNISVEKSIPLNQLLLVTVFAPFIEEFLKFIMAYISVLRSRYDNEPIDPIIFMITTALGFAAIENMLFLMDPISTNNLHLSIYTGNMRFIGAMLLHTVSSATVGIFIGFNLFDKKIRGTFWTLVGICSAILIHALFNFFMMSSGQNYLIVLEVIWITVIIVLFVLEKIKKIKLEKI